MIARLPCYDKSQKYLVEYILQKSKCPRVHVVRLEPYSRRCEKRALLIVAHRVSLTEEQGSPLLWMQPPGRVLALALHSVRNL
jgi:hypothetical protein